MTRRRAVRRPVREGAALAALIVLVGCANAPTKKIAKAELAVEEADPKTAEYAPLELRQARQKLRAAQEAAEDDDHDRARRLAEQALVDAQLARAKARAEVRSEYVDELQRSVDAVAGEATRTIESLREESGR
jgi:predicted lipid-binding transport protein (Tim44 family)